MKTFSIIVIIILFFGLIGGILFVHYKYEKPKEQNVIYLIDLSIFAQEGNNLVRTNYSVYSNGFFIGNSLTNEYGAALYKVPLNSTITIINSNLEGQNYYKNRIDFFTEKNETTRVIIPLISVGNLTVITNNSNYKINATVSSNGYFKNMIVCLDWSIHVIFAEINNMTQIQNIGNTTKCYQGSTLDNNNFNFIINYQTFGNVDLNDYINVNFYDFDENYKLRKNYKIGVLNNNNNNV